MVTVVTQLVIVPSALGQSTPADPIRVYRPRRIVRHDGNPINVTPQFFEEAQAVCVRAVPPSVRTKMDSHRLHARALWLRVQDATTECLYQCPTSRSPVIGSQWARRRCGEILSPTASDLQSSTINVQAEASLRGCCGKLIRRAITAQ